MNCEQKIASCALCGGMVEYNETPHEQRTDKFLVFAVGASIVIH